ncbi:MULTISPECIES: dihydrofolate reductase [unclassified Janthinobacterium]|uniref:dihydrofolate reductase n=1 Tax=unclassified Janthinobacterium TaxID=2610881 RepID=UPI00161294F6|nr:MULTISPECIES: dihydrofolate reductase [unclassified Janthinobacterium]MBB5368521.1 dihydrofolate reductase [Janthinobacterium sp. K2C7]MBB5381943.1 dihydrofolate reductase [Janthinobacterium sp. K2Li3]MBB5386903.1 dihydrofolate reductase [Janthinobacterium sp. K2E3]
MSLLTIIVATDQQGGIGINNTLPWKLPEDLAHFKRLTTGHPIIMGRKTFDSIGRPLPNRRNIVITRNAEWRHEGVEAVASVADAIALLDGVEGYVIGGAEIYKQSLVLTQRLIVTEIGQTYDCDAFFPAIDHAEWQETAREEHVAANSGLPYAFVTLQRKA